MGAIIPVKIEKPHENYQFKSGDIRQIAQNVIKELGEQDAKKVTECLCLELGIGDFKN